MRKLNYRVRRSSLMGGLDAAIITTDDLATELAESIIDGISTEIEVTIGDKTVHLAMLLDPDHWSSDWESLDIEDVELFLAENVEDDA